MDLQPYIDNIQRQVVVAAEAGGDDARAVAERLLAPLDAAIRLTLQDALAAAADEITVEIAPGSVELRLRGRDPEFVVSAPVTEHDEASEPAQPVTAGAADGDDGAVARINLRMPDQLKGRVEQAAAGDGCSVNSWLVRAATTALDRPESRPRREARAPGIGQRYTGWAR